MSLLEHTILMLSAPFLISALVVTVSAIPFVLARIWDWVAAGRRREPLRIWHLAVAVAGVAVVMSINMPGSRIWLTFACIAILTGFVRAWRAEVGFLMSLEDHELPGRSSRVLWVILLVGLAPIGFWLFQYFRCVHLRDAIVPADFASLPERLEPQTS